MKIPLLSNLLTLYRLSKMPDEVRDSLENPSTSLMKAFSVMPAKSGVPVDEEHALRVTTVLACVRVIAETIGSLPLPVYRRLNPRGKERDPSHPLYQILHDRPNPYMSAMTWRETMLGHVLLWGNGYSEIEFTGGGDIAALWPLRPDHTRPEVDRDTGRLTYITYIRGEMIRIAPERILHIPGFGFDGIRGYSPIRLAKESIGLTIALEQYGATFFGNDASPGGVLQRPLGAPVLQEQGLKNLKSDWEAMHQGMDRKHRIAVLEEGTTWEQIGVNPQDAQALEARKFQVSEICRIFRVPPHKVADLEKATFSNIEHQSIEFVTDTIRPWVVRFEQAANWKLFTQLERNRYFTEHVIDGLLRGDRKTRTEALHIERQDGIISANDWREIENMNPLPPEIGDVYVIQLNMVPLNLLGDGSDNSEEDTERTAAFMERRGLQALQIRRNISQSYRNIFVDTTARVIRRERNDVMAAAKKMFDRRDLRQFRTWLEEFYRDHVEFTTRQFAPVYEGIAEGMRNAAEQEIGTSISETGTYERFTRDYLDVFSKRYAGSSYGQLEEVARKAEEAGEDPVAALDERFNEWEENRPDKTADWEVVRSENAFTKEAYLIAGIAAITWIAIGESCPYCKSLNGRVIGINENFLGVDEVFEPEDAPAPLTFSSDIGHPPAHPGCDCGIGIA